MSTPTYSLPPYNPVEQLPPPTHLFPSLRVVQQTGGEPTRYRAYLTRALADRLNLRAHQPIDLLPPSANHPYWHLDLRPQARRRLAWYADSRPRIQHLCFPATVLGEQATSLVLCLVPGDPAFPGFYPLLPQAFFIPKQ